MNSSWINTTIGGFLTLQRGHDLTASERRDGQFPVMGAAGQNGCHDTAKVNGPGIVVGRSGGSFGQVHFCRSDFWPHNTALYVSDYKGNDIYYAYYLLKNLDFNRLNSGSAQPSLNRNFVHPVRIRVPRPDEQRKIASILANLDAKIELNHRINQELEGLAKLLYDYWFVQFDFPISAEQAAAMGDPTLQGKPYRQSGGKMTYNPTLKREIPEGWRAGNILDVSKLGGGGTPSKEKPNWWNGDILFFTPTDTTNEVFCLTTEEKITDEGLNKSATKLYPAGTIFITARGSVGRVVITASDSAMSQSCYALQPNTGVSSGFLYFHIHALMGYLKAKSSGSVFKSIVTNDLQFSPSVVPPLEVMESFGSRTSAIFSQILNNQKQNQELATLRDWLLPMLMNGQVTVAH